MIDENGVETFVSVNGKLCVVESTLTFYQIAELAGMQPTGREKIHWDCISDNESGYLMSGESILTDDDMVFIVQEGHE